MVHIDATEEQLHLDLLRQEDGTLERRAAHHILELELGAHDGFSWRIEPSQPSFNSLASGCAKEPTWVNARIAAATAFADVTENIGATSGDAEAVTRYFVVHVDLFFYGWALHLSCPQQLSALMCCNRTPRLSALSLPAHFPNHRRRP